jgi:hypothetical protein
LLYRPPCLLFCTFSPQKPLFKQAILQKHGMSLQSPESSVCYAHSLTTLSLSHFISFSLRAFPLLLSDR